MKRIGGDGRCGGDRGGGAMTPGEANRRSFGLIATATLAATALVLGMMWMKGLRYDGASLQPVVEQQ